MANNIVASNFSNSENQSSPFDAIRQYDDRGREWWSARDLQKMLGYKAWQMFDNSIDLGLENLESAIGDVSSHALILEITLKHQKAKDYKLSRIACYHIALACDSRGKPNVKSAKHYFAVKTREAEIAEPIAPQPRQLPPQRDYIEHLQAAKEISLLDDPILKSYLLQACYEEIGASKALPPSDDVLVLAAVKARSLGFTLKPGEDGKLGKWVAKHCNPLGKTQHGRYEVNVYRDDDRLVETIGAFFA